MELTKFLSYLTWVGLIASGLFFIINLLMFRIRKEIKNYWTFVIIWATLFIVFQILINLKN